MAGITELSTAQAQKLVLLAQGLHRPCGKGVNGVLQAIGQLGYVQIDSISVIQRAHHHTLWNRVADYSQEHLDALLAERKVFEYWSHAAAYLPMSDYRFSLPRKRAIATGDKHWFDRDDRLMREIRGRIASEGPLMARDFEHPRRENAGWWDWKPAKKALEQLFMEGELMAVERRGFQKVYDLTERALPAEVDTSVPDEGEYLRYLITRYLSANAFAKPEHCCYLLKGMLRPIRQKVAEMLAEGNLIKLRIGGKKNTEEYVALANVTDDLAKRIPADQVRILSPFDNLLIQRKRTRALFDFDYQLECYVPEAKRRFGYFALPIMSGRRFIGRMDVKTDRNEGCMRVRHLHFEESVSEDCLDALCASLQTFMAFNHVADFRIEKLTGMNLAARELVKRL